MFLDNEMIYFSEINGDIEYQPSQPNVLNPSQEMAVSNAININKGMFLIQGPPGTGKTTTIIEIINKFVKSGQKILVCATTNDAVDELCRRIPETVEKLRIGVLKNCGVSIQQHVLVYFKM